MDHALFKQATPEERGAAIEAADWMLDGVATATQDRTLLRGEDDYNDVLGDAILANAIIACLRAINNLKQSAEREKPND